MLTVKGRLKSVDTRNFGQNPKIVVVVESLNEKDQYQRPVLLDITLSKKHVEGGYRSELEKLVGKAIEVPVFVSPWSGRNGPSYTLYLQDCDTKSIVLKAA